MHGNKSAVFCTIGVLCCSDNVVEEAPQGADEESYSTCVVPPSLPAMAGRVAVSLVQSN